MKRSLDIYLHQKLVGQLHQDQSGRLSFTYHPDYLASPYPRLSISLPLQSAPLDRQITRAFFSGFLPEDQLRTWLAKDLSVSAANPFALLYYVGGDCAGAIEMYPKETKPSFLKKPKKILLKESALTQALKKINRHPFLTTEHKVRMSLAGAHTKLAVLLENKKIYLIEGEPSSHILKPAIPHVKDSIYNEYFCLKLAQMIGIESVEATLNFASQRPYLLISRYDRQLQKTKRVRIHQEDFCQALGIPPELKYQREGGPSLTQCLQLVLQHSARPAADRNKLLQRFIFNYLIGNADAHGKNFSLLHHHWGDEKAGALLAPAYDLLSTEIYPELEHKMAMKIGSTYDPNRVLLRHWHQMVGDLEASKRQLDHEMKKMAQTLPKTSSQLQKTLRSQKINSPIFTKIHQKISQRSQKILNYFA